MSIITDNCENDMLLLNSFEEKCNVTEYRLKTNLLYNENKFSNCNGENTALEMQASSVSRKKFDFDAVIGLIEDILIDDEFHELQENFLEKYWREFIDSEENKHEYMTIFMEYANQIEAFIENYLKKIIPHFEMEALIRELEKRKDSLDGEVFEVLFTLTDFNIFKEMFLDYRMMKEGNVIDVGQSLHVSPIE